MRISRRHFVQGALGTVLLSPFAKAEKRARSKDPDVVIIGAGAAGLAAAYQLSKAGMTASVFEGSGRCGGRIFTRYRFNEENQFAERGGEFVDTNHYTLRGLADELGLSLVKLDGRGLTKDNTGDLFSYRGQVYRFPEFVKNVGSFISHIKKVSKEIYRGDDDHYLSARNLSRFPSLARYDRMSMSEFLEKAGDKTERWILEMIKTAYVCEWGLDADEQSSINLIDLIDTEFDPNDSTSFEMFGDSDEAYRLAQGSQSLTDALFKQAALASDFQFDHKLESIRQRGSKIELTFQVSGQVKTVQASTVICTLPFSVLREVDGFGKGGIEMRSGLKRAISELGMGQNTKIILGFRRRFWNRGKQQLSGALYSDGSAQNYWETSRGQQGKLGIITNYRGGKKALELGGASVETIAKGAMRDLIPPFGDTPLREYDGRANLHCWPLSPWSRGSYSCPRVGQYSEIWGWQTWDGQAPSLLKGRVLLAGEHTHPLSFGYMNGALNTGIRAANEVIRTQSRKPAPPIPGRRIAQANEGAEEHDN